MSTDSHQYTGVLKMVTFFMFCKKMREKESARSFYH